MKYVVGGIGIVVVVIALILLILGLIRRDPAPEITNDTVSLTDHIDGGSEVVITAYGQIVADEEFRAIRVTVSDSRRVLEIMHGYNLRVEERIELPNTINAYDAFMKALENANYTNVREGQPESEEGKCAANRRNTYKLIVDGDVVHRTWSSPCRTELGTFGGQVRQIENLFRNQIPDYRDHTRGVRL